MNYSHIVSQMTVDEKIALCKGKDFWHLESVERLGIPSIMVTDGPHGLRKQAGDSDHVGLNNSEPATCFPTASGLAATWNRELVQQVGVALGEETRAENVGVILGPGVNIKRSPLCGRNFEYFSEDPYLSGEMAKSHINGVQSQGVGTSLKHYAANNQEFRRLTIDSVIDERALREIYLPSYETAVKEAQPWTVMCAYNKINGTYASEHHRLMTEILRDEWGFEGIVVTDWGAMNDRVLGLKAGVDLEMPGIKFGNAKKIKAALESGELDMATLDKSVERIVRLICKANETLQQPHSYDKDEHHALARKVAGEVIVLLKNEGDLLPLDAKKGVALIGRFAKHPRYQGAGSSQIIPTKLDNLHDEVVKLIGADNVAYAEGYRGQGDEVDTRLIADAVKVAQSAETAIVCIGLTDLYEVEGKDRSHMQIPPAHAALVEAIAAAHENVVVVLSNGSPIEMSWLGKVPAVVEGYLGGQAGAGAMADVLFGNVNPSGKLAETFPIKLADNPSYHYFPGGPRTVEYRESIYVGYRYYDSVEQEVLFPFGHGLSYTTFEYSDLQLDRSTLADTDTLTVSVKVTNSGEVAGKEVVQLYVRDVEAGVFRPKKELKGFDKVALEPGETKTVTFEIGRRAFAFYDVDIADWVVEAGEFEILIGASAHDIRLNASVEVTSPTPQATRQPSFYDDFPKGTAVPQYQFERLLGRAVPDNSLEAKGTFTLNTPISDMKESFIGRQLKGMMKKQMDSLLGEDEDATMSVILDSMLEEAPLRMMLMAGEGKVTGDMLDSLVTIINGKTLRGVGGMVKAIRGK